MCFYKTLRHRTCGLAAAPPRPFSHARAAPRSYLLLFLPKRSTLALARHAARSRLGLSHARLVVDAPSCAWRLVSRDPHRADGFRVIFLGSVVRPILILFSSRPAPRGWIYPDIVLHATRPARMVSFIHYARDPPRAEGLLAMARHPLVAISQSIR